METLSERDRRRTMPNELALFSGNANRPLAQEIADYLGLRLGDALVGRFKDGEIRVSVHENVRGVLGRRARAWTGHSRRGLRRTISSSFW